MEPAPNGPHPGGDAPKAKLHVSKGGEPPSPVGRTVEEVARLVPLRPALAAAKVSLTAIDTNRARAFARAEGVSAKPDAIDARPPPEEAAR